MFSSICHTFVFHEDSKDTGVWKYWVYGNTAVSVYNMDHTLRCLEFIGSVSSP